MQGVYFLSLFTFLLIIHSSLQRFFNFCNSDYFWILFCHMDIVFLSAFPWYVHLYFDVWCLAHWFCISQNEAFLMGKFIPHTSIAREWSTELCSEKSITCGQIIYFEQKSLLSYFSFEIVAFNCVLFKEYLIHAFFLLLWTCSNMNKPILVFLCIGHNTLLKVMIWTKGNGLEYVSCFSK